MTPAILAVVDELIFLSRIERTAQLLGIAVQSTSVENLATHLKAIHPQGVILDLNHRSGKALEIVRALKGAPSTSHIRVMGFVSHVQSDLIAAAHTAGCDIILARSAFTQQLPELLQKMAGIQTASPLGT